MISHFTLMQASELNIISEVEVRKMLSLPIVFSKESRDQSYLAEISPFSSRHHYYNTEQQIQLNFQHICIFVFYLLFRILFYFIFLLQRVGKKQKQKKIPHKEEKQSYRNLEFMAKRLPEKFSKAFSLVSQLLTKVIFQVLCSYSFLPSTLSTILHLSCKKDSLSPLTGQLCISSQMLLPGLRAQFSQRHSQQNYRVVHTNANSLIHSAVSPQSICTFSRLQYKMISEWSQIH